MSETVTAFEAYDSEPARQHLLAIDALRNFSGVQQWDERARWYVDEIRGVLERLTRRAGELAQIEARALAAHSAKSVFRRAFSSPAEISAVAAWRKRFEDTKRDLGELSEEIEAAIDRTPDSPEEQQEMLADLKLMKKELTLAKRETSEAMRQLRTEARQRSATIGTGLAGVFSTPSSRRVSRIVVRLDKEAKVAPHEEMRAEVERRILAVDRLIHWIERIK